MSVKLFSDLFKGRTDAYGLNQICLKEPLTEEVYNAHLKGEKRIGVYPILEGSKTNWLAIDIDDGDFEKAVNFKKKASHFGLNAYIECSKSKGYHVWIFFEEPVEAVKPRLIAEMILKELDFKCEIFPKQDEVNESHPYGNFIFLPLFGGDTKSKKTVFLNTQKQVVIKDSTGLHKIKKTSIEAINKIIELNDLKREKVEYKTEPIDDRRISSSVLPCIEKIKEGKFKDGEGRNECAFRLCIFYKERGMPEDDIRTLMSNWNLKNIDHLSKKELTTIIDSVFKGKYKSYGCDSGIIQKFCDKENCPFIQAQDRKAKIEQGLITLVFRDEQTFVFRKFDYEYRLTNFEFSKAGKFTSTISISKAGSLLFKDIIQLDKASHRKRFVTATKNKDVELDLIKIEELVRKQIEKEEKEKLERPKQLYIMTETEKDEAIKFLETSPHILFDVIKTTNGMGVVGEESLRLMIYLCFTSRVTKEPISITVKGETSSGKSFSCQCIKKLIPEEGYHFITRATQQAFYHLPEDGMQHKIIFINELPGSESADYSIRSAQSEGDLVLMMPVKDPVTGDMETRSKLVKGPCGFLITTTKAAMFNENETRNFSIFTDDSPSLTKDIGDITARKSLGEEFIVPGEVLNKFKNAQRLLNAEFKVVIPFGKEVFSAFPDKPVRVRRDRERFRELIEIITLIHQFHREQKQDDKGRLILKATLADYLMAKLIAGDTLLHTIYEIGPSSKQVWNALVELEEQWKQTDDPGPFTFKYKDISDALNWKKEKTKKWTLTLMTAGIIEYEEQTSGGRGKASVFKIGAKRLDFALMGEGFLPSVEDLWEKYPCDTELFYNPITGAKIKPEFADAPDQL